MPRSIRPLAAVAVVAFALAAGPAAAKQKTGTESGTAPAAAGSGSLSGSYLAGRFAQSRRDVAAAARFLGHALDLDPEAPDLLRRTFLLTLMAGRVTEAAALARDLTAKSDRSPMAHLTLAVVGFKESDWKGAEARMARLPDSGLNIFTKPLLRAWARVGMGDPDAALAALAPLAKTKGAGILHDLHAALIHEQAGRFDAAVKLYVKVTETQEAPSLRLTQLLGNLYERTGEPERARALYRLYQEDNPGSTQMRAALKRLEGLDKPQTLVATAGDGIAEALFGIAGSLQRQSLGETALVLGRLALYLKADFPIMRFMVGGILEGEDRLEQAIATYRRVPAQSPFGWAARLRVAGALDDLKRPDEAVALLRAMAKEQGEDATPLIALGDVFRGEKRWAEAVDAYDAAVERVGRLEPHHWRLLYSRGIALERAKRWPRAEADFKTALEFEPDQPFILNYLGYSWIEQGLHLDEAQAMIEKAVQRRPNDGYIVDSLGWGYYQLGEFEKAVRELERAVELRPHDPTINDHLGDAYWRAGRKREARFQWNHALANDPEDDLRPKIEAKLENGLTDPAPNKRAKTDGG